jgi:hypothetical protein
VSGAEKRRLEETKIKAEINAAPRMTESPCFMKIPSGLSPGLASSGGRLEILSII